MATYNKFDAFSEQLAGGVHNFDAAGHQLEVYLSNTAPSAADDAVKADLAEISTGNGYTGPQDVQNSTSRTGGTTTISGVDVLITATGAVGPFQYGVLFNTTPTSPADPLISWWAYPSAISLADGETFRFRFGGGDGPLFTIA